MRPLALTALCAALALAGAAVQADTTPPDETSADSVAQGFWPAFKARIRELRLFEDHLPPPERLEKPGLSNLAHVEGGIYRGSRPLLDQGGMKSLRELGIKTIINLQGGDLTAPSQASDRAWPAVILAFEPGEAFKVIGQEAAAARPDIEMVNYALDSLDPITDAEAADIDRILKIIAASSLKNPVYVHCEHGKDRTGLVIALYRMRYDGWSLEKAREEMKEMGHTGFLDHLFTGHMDLNRVVPRYPYLAVRP